MDKRQKYVKRASQFVIAVQVDLETDGFTYKKWGSTQTCKRGDWLVHNNGGYDFFWTIYGRNSFDGKGTPIEANVHYGRNYENAFWSSKGMIFGDGDGTVFNRFTASIDIIAHTFAHGVVGALVQLEYWEQSGALMESNAVMSLARS